MGDFMKRDIRIFRKLICMGAVILAVIPLLFVAGKSVQVPEEYLILLFKRPLYLRMMWWNSLIITIPVFDWTAFACTACRIRLLAMQVEIQGDFVLSLHDCHAYAAAADFSAKLFSGELAGHSKFVLGNYSSGNVSAIGGILIRQQIQDFPQET